MKTNKSKKLSFDQTEEENRNNFIARLVEAGWPKKEAIKEWERIQSE